MKRKLLLSFTTAVIFLTGLGVFASQSTSLGHLFDSGIFAKTKNVKPYGFPGVNESDSSLDQTREFRINQNDNSSSCTLINDETAFDMFFIKVVSLDRTAAHAKSRGESGNLSGNYLRREGFADDEIAAIRRIARDHAAEIAPLHAKAVQIIKSGRETFRRNGHLPSPPLELTDLQEQRSALVIRNMKRMESMLGPHSVERARMLMKSKSKATPVDPTSLMNPEERISRFNQLTQSRSNRQGESQND